MHVKSHVLTLENVFKLNLAMGIAVCNFPSGLLCYCGIELVIEKKNIKLSGK